MARNPPCSKYGQAAGLFSGPPAPRYGGGTSTRPRVRRPAPCTGHPARIGCPAPKRLPGAQRHAARGHLSLLVFPASLAGLPAMGLNRVANDRLADGRPILGRVAFRNGAPNRPAL